MNMAKKKTSTKAKGTSPTSEAHTSGPMTTTGAGYAVGSIDTLDDTTLVVHSPDSPSPWPLRDNPTSVESVS